MTIVIILKKAHALAYAMAIVLQINLMVKDSMGQD